jgi:hypothetical protein
MPLIFIYPSVIVRSAENAKKYLLLNCYILQTKAEYGFLKPYCKTASRKTRIETIKNEGGK